MAAEDIIAIYKKRWLIENLFKQLKQNFPLRYFYGERANAIKIQIWITLIANLFITLVKNKIKRPWSFSGLATMIRILLMSYVSIQTDSNILQYSRFNQYTIQKIPFKRNGILSCGSKFIFTTTLYVANTQCFTTYQLLLIPQR